MRYALFLITMYNLMYNRTEAGEPRDSRESGAQSVLGKLQQLRDGVT